MSAVNTALAAYTSSVTTLESDLGTGTAAGVLETLSVSLPELAAKVGIWETAKADEDAARVSEAGWASEMNFYTVLNDYLNNSSTYTTGLPVITGLSTAGESLDSIVLPSMLLPAISPPPLETRAWPPTWA